MPPVDPRQHVAEQRRRDRHHPSAGVGQMKRPRSSRLVYSDIPVPQDLQQIVAAAAKDVDAARMQIARQRLLHLQGQSVHPTPHVGGAGREPDAHAGGRHNSRSTDRTRRSATKLTVSPTRTRISPTSSISIDPAQRAAAGRHAGGASGRI
jgi:hypothetical protein